MDKEVRVGEAKTAEKTPHTTRRAFVRAAGQVAVTGPAISILLTGSAIPAVAQRIYLCRNSSVRGEAPCARILDDFTFGNNEEDIDAFALGSNFNNFNGQRQIDDFVP